MDKFVFVKTTLVSLLRFEIKMHSLKLILEAVFSWGVVPTIAAKFSSLFCANRKVS